MTQTVAESSEPEKRTYEDTFIVNFGQVVPIEECHRFMSFLAKNLSEGCEIKGEESKSFSYDPYDGKRHWPTSTEGESSFAKLKGRILYFTLAEKKTCR